MKTLLDCDAVFEALTSGCEAGREDGALDEHLEGCPQCRQLANAIAPATDFLVVELCADERNECSAHHLANKVFARLDAERTVILAESHRRSFLYLNAHAWSQLGAAAAILLALGGLFWATSPRESAGQLAALPTFAAPLARGSEPSEHGLLHFASLQLPGSCLTSVTSQDSAAQFQCCTRCHHSGDMLPVLRLVAFSQQSCLACHKS